MRRSFFVFPVIVFLFVVYFQVQRVDGQTAGGDTAVLPLAITTSAATDACADAPELVLPGGAQTTTNNMTIAGDDPVLDFVWGSPASAQGFRTVWYKITTTNNGRIVLDTFGSNYDTILAVYTGSCGSLSRVTGNDDYQGFTSRVTFTAARNTTYYVEIADWQSGTSGTATLTISAWEEPFVSQWTQVDTMPLPRSRHAIVTDGTDVYLIGGESSMTGTPQLTTRVERYETDTGNWVQLADMPGTGYADTTAALVNGRIYLPGGYNGNNTSFDDTHWVYDISANSWTTATAVTTVSSVPLGWATAVVPPAQNGYYLVGGISTLPPLTTTAQVHNEMYFYFPPPNDQWVSRAPMNSPRYGHTAAWVNGKVCVAGGVSTGNVLLSNGECYDPTTGIWTNTNNMNYPRYNAGSAVGADGKWYVFGGIDAFGNAVSITEVYDSATNSWTALPVDYDLGGTATLPARGWPRGVLAGNSLWVFGGNSEPDKQVLPLVEKLFVPISQIYMPVVFGIKGNADDTMAQARPLTLNQAQQHNFDTPLDFFDVYYFDLAATTAVTIQLSQIPLGSDYNVSLYSANKLLWGKGDNPGNLVETISTTLPAGRYYLLVERVFPFGTPNSANYHIIVTTN